MLTAYIVVATILAVAGLLVAVVLLIDNIDIGDSEDWKIWRAGVSLGLLGIIFWPLVFILAAPTLVVWGLVNAWQLFREYRQSEQ